MTQEEKELLLKDLCARLPYGCFMQVQHCIVECRHHLLGVNTENNTIYIDHCNESNKMLFISNWMPINDCKPYLRPMSSMTEDELFEIEQEFNANKFGDLEKWSWLENGCTTFDIEKEVCPYIDWLNSHHFDYRGLIEKGIALEAPEGMYKN